MFTDFYRIPYSPKPLFRHPLIRISGNHLFISCFSWSEGEKTGIFLELKLVREGRNPTSGNRLYDRQPLPDAMLPFGPKDRRKDAAIFSIWKEPSQYAPLLWMRFASQEYPLWHLWKVKKRSSLTIMKEAQNGNEKERGEYGRFQTSPSWREIKNRPVFLRTRNSN